MRNDPNRFNDRIRELHAAGLSDRKIAAILGFAPDWIGDLRKKLGLPTQYELVTGRNPMRHKAEDIDYDEVDRLAMAYRLFAQGCGVRQVAAVLGIDLETAERYRREMPADWAKEYPARDPKPEPPVYAKRRGHRRGKAVA